MSSPSDNPTADIAALPRRSADIVNREHPLRRVTAGYLWAMLFWLIVGLSAGLSFATQFVPELADRLIPAGALHGGARMRMAHSIVMIYGVILNALLAGFHAAAPRWKRPESVIARGALALQFGLYQLALLGGVAAVIYGSSRPLIWNEIPFPLDLGIALVLARIFYLLLSDRAPRGGARLLHAWTTGAAVAGLTAFTLWNFFNSAVLSGVQLSVATGVFRAHLVYLLLVPSALGLLLWRGGVMLGADMERRRLAWMGLASIFFFGPLANLELYVLPPVQGALQTLTQIATLGYAVGVCLVILNFFAAVSGVGLERSLPCLVGSPLRWYALACVSLFLLTTENALLAWPPFANIVQMTDWTAGHHHMLFAGTLGAVVFGLADDLWPRMRGREGWLFPRLSDAHFIGTVAGLVIMILPLLVVGYIQGTLFDIGGPWADILRRSRPFWIVRLIGGCLIALAQLCLIVNVLASVPRSRDRLIDDDADAANGAAAIDSRSGDADPDSEEAVA